MKRGQGNERHGWGLAAVAARAAQGHAHPEELLDAFLAATVYCKRPERPESLAVAEPGEGVIQVFSSLDELAAHTGGCDWVSATGRDLLELLPAGHDLVLDAASEHAVWLHTRALRRRTADPPGSVVPRPRGQTTCPAP
ncbi:MAG: hypothetical protein GEV03_16120 [Streptosporangiales bacterium]|nr:hypothetical protein [Streptosporangiales bacterium]